MKATIRLLTFLAALTLSQMAVAQIITGDVSAGGDFSGTVTSSNAWVTSSAFDGESVNFWTLTANAGDRISLNVTSTALEFGISVYAGLVEQTELLFAGFSNEGNFGDNVFIAGTNPTTGAIGTSLLDILLPTSGVYTLAIGGEAGFPFDGLFDYDLNVQIAPVPLPAAIWLLGSGLLGLVGLRRRVSM